MKYLPTLIFFLFLVFCSCNTHDFSNYFIRQATVSIDFPIELSRKTLLVKPYFKDDEKKLYWYDESLNSIYIFDLITSSISDTISIKMEGPDGIRKIYGYTIKSPDSLYASRYVPGELLLLNSSGVVINKLHFGVSNDATQINNVVLLNSKVWTDIYFDGNELIIPLQTPNFREKPTEEIWKNFNLFFRINDSVETCSVKMPKLLYNEKNQPVMNNLSSCKLNNNIYFAFYGDHEIYKTGNCNIYDSKNISSAYKSEIYAIRDFAIYDDFMCRTFHYGNLYADSYRNLIYRIANIPDEEIEFNCLYRGEVPSIFSIMVLDPELNLLQELKIDGKKYSIIHAFVDENGLNLRRSAFHPEYDEEKLVFDAFSFSN